jgi:hemoglobin/transferrin/lactoferrin receptor protein
LTETDPSTGLRHAQWYYGPQERVLGIYSLNKKKLLFQRLETTIAYKGKQAQQKVWKLFYRRRSENVFRCRRLGKFKSGELFYSLNRIMKTSSAYSINEHWQKFNQYTISQWRQPYVAKKYIFPIMIK